MGIVGARRAGCAAPAGRLLAGMPAIASSASMLQMHVHTGSRRARGLRTDASTPLLQLRQRQVLQHQPPLVVIVAVWEAQLALRAAARLRLRVLLVPPGCCVGGGRSGGGSGTRRAGRPDLQHDQRVVDTVSVACKFALPASSAKATHRCARAPAGPPPSSCIGALTLLGGNVPGSGRHSS